MNKKLIILSGKKRVGKDTVANLFNDYTQRKYELRAFAEPVKEIVSKVTRQTPYTLDLFKDFKMVGIDSIDSNLTISSCQWYIEQPNYKGAIPKDSRFLQGSTWGGYIRKIITSKNSQ